MTQLKTVIKFELNSYFKNKGYILATIIFSLILGVGLCIPRFLEMGGIIDNDDDKKTEQAAGNPDADKKDDKEIVLLYDTQGVITDTAYMDKKYPEYEWKKISDQKALEDQVNDETAVAGAVITGPTTFDYVVKNSAMYDDKKDMITDILSYNYRYNYMVANKIDPEKMETVIDTPIVSNNHILGKDSVGSFGYTYVLIFVIYLMIILYGQMIATSVTSEKSNRAIEVLVTSSKPEYLIFGKVIAGAIASFLQIAIVLGVGLVSYNYNASAWNGLLDTVFEIPTTVLIVFIIFLVSGFFFYSFLYASLGALVSKTEDISKSAGPVMFIFVIGFMLAMFGLNDPEGILVRVTSFIPFTSCYMMLVRAAMGTISVVEIIISAIISIGSSVLVGVIGAKIYRLGTLHYGNPIKFSTALKSVLKEKQ
ncbi:MAG: ABC transporter permease [bacterium]|nr:ABC transporter permease [bacterium]